MSGKGHELRPEGNRHLEERRRSSNEPWRTRLDIFCNPHLSEKSDIPFDVRRDPLKLKAYQQAMTTQKALNLTRQVSFRDGLFGPEMNQSKASLTSLLATRGIHCENVLVQAMNVVYGVSMSGEGVLERAYDLAGSGMDIVARISDIANIPRILVTIEEVGTAKFNELTRSTGGDLEKAFGELGNYLNPELKPAIKEWWLVPDAHAMQTVSETIRNLKGPDFVAELTVLLHAMCALVPGVDIATQKKIRGPTKKLVEIEMKRYISDCIGAAKGTVNADTSNDQRLGRIIADAGAFALNIASNGIEFDFSPTAPEVIKFPKIGRAHV